MKTSAIVYAALFTITMIASYLTWTADPEPVDDDGSIVLLDTKPEDVAKISFTSKDIDVEIENKSDDLGTYLWGATERRVDKTKRKNPHDPHAVAPDGAETEKKGDDEIEKLAFKAGKAAEALIDAFAPFRVTRKLNVPEDKLADYGFDEPSGNIVLSTKSGKEHKFQVGDTAYGHKHVYLRDEASGEVYVIKRDLVGPLERADTRLPEKELFPGDVSGITKATITTPSDTLALVQRNRDDAAKAMWTTSNDTAPNAVADSWLDKVFRLRSAGYVATEPQTELVVAVKLEFEDGDHKPVRLELLRGADPKTGEESWYARSEYTRAVVKLNSGMASDTAADVATLFAAPEE